MDSRHAYLILAHNEGELLSLLCRLLDYEKHELFIHIDKKTPKREFEKMKKAIVGDNVHFVPRMRITWAGTSMMRCTLLLLRYARERGDFSYYHLISGTDLPLRPAEEIYSFFEENKGAEFIHFCNEAQTAARIENFSLYHFFTDLYGKERNLFYYLTRLSLWVQRALGVNRLKGSELTFKRGAQWFSITDELCKYILERKDRIEKTFSHSRVTDEMFLQMLIWNTEFMDRLYRPANDPDYHSIMRYIDWERGEPYTFCIDDLEELRNSDYMFARKFSFERDPELCLELAKQNNP